MGTSPSKEEPESETIANNLSKESNQHDSNTIPSYEAKEESMLAQSHEKMAAAGKKMMQTLSGPKSPKSNGGFGSAQSRMDRQLANDNLASPKERERRDDVAPTKHIADEMVQVNLAMADLMAYLQVVANNSNNLPLTRRDDPELGRMVSTLTSEEYARKSAAFVPADVRVLGGSFTKYGRVWDLPTSDEYTVLDGAQEPGTQSEDWKSLLLFTIDLTHFSYLPVQTRSFVRRCLL